MATLADVAREAGVSAVAVSVVLNGAKTATRTSAETRARVLDAAERLRYRPNASARALVHGRANAIGIVACHWQEQANLYFLEVFSGVIEAATAAEQTTSVFMLRGWDEAPRRIPAFGDGRIDGLILLAPRLAADASDWLPRHIPCVSLHSERPLKGVVNLEPDEEEGAFVAVSHMLALGHRRILHVGGPMGLTGPERRVAGYLRAHAAAGVKPPAAGYVVRAAALNADAGRDVVLEWLRRHRRGPLPEAVFCCNDAIAVGCIDALSMQGLRVPDDVSVVGFDDTLLARSARMATVRQPLHELGRRAVELLMEQNEARREGGAWQGPENIVLPTEFVARATLAAPRRVTHRHPG
jgi:LacI family transcriptional regulator